MKVFNQKVLPTYGLDENFERTGSVSPLKYRPKVNWDGFSDLRPLVLTDEKSPIKRTRTPDPINGHRTPQRSLSPDAH